MYDQSDEARLHAQGAVQGSASVRTSAGYGRFLIRQQNSRGVSALLSTGCGGKTFIRGPDRRMHSHTERKKSMGDGECCLSGARCSSWRREWHCRG